MRRLIPGADDGWAAAGVDEFLRGYLTPAGRAAFYAAARQIYLEEPEGEDGFWTRLRALQPDALFVWGRRDTLVPIAFARHVAEALPGPITSSWTAGTCRRWSGPGRPTRRSRVSRGIAFRRAPPQNAAGVASNSEADSCRRRVAGDRNPPVGLLSEARQLPVLLPGRLRDRSGLLVTGISGHASPAFRHRCCGWKPGIVTWRQTAHHGARAYIRKNPDAGVENYGADGRRHVIARRPAARRGGRRAF